MKSRSLFALTSVIYLSLLSAAGGGSGSNVAWAQIPPSPVADPTGINKCRFISFSVPGAATAAVGDTALRVRLVSLHRVNPPYTNGPSIPFTAYEGQVRWVGPPAQYIESNSNPIQFYASFLQCAPYYQDWSTVGLLHVTGSAIVPSSEYEVSSLALTCLGNEETCTDVSAALSIKTSRWGDVAAPFQDPLNPTVTQPSTGDVAALLAKFQSQPGAIIKARALLAGLVGTTCGIIDITPDVGLNHISVCQDAVIGKPYPYTICGACNTVDDCDGDGIVDKEEANPADRDCDRDGICNGVEIANCIPGDSSCADCNSNSIPDGCEPDCNGNHIADSCDIANCPPGDPSCADCTGNGIPDGCEPAQDCNFNLIADSCDIANCPPGDTSCADCNSNGVPDGCEQGGCCLDPGGDGTYEGCSPGSTQSCAQANGIWRGVCHPCPTQNAAIIPEPGGGVFIHIIGAPIDCLAETTAPRRACPPAGPFYDAWKSDANASMCHNFGAPGQSIPADFFNPGSDVFAGSLCLAGVPLGASGFGAADTLIQRSADPFDRCSLPTAPPVNVQIDIFALSLESVDPIVVTYNGGSTPEMWNVTVDRSSVIPPSGMLTATKTHCNGGTYTSVLNVQPRFTFTKVGDPGLIRVLDTGQAGIPYVILDQQIPSDWVHDPDPNLGLTGDPCSHFHPGIEDMSQSTACDCNNNLVRDVCDVENGSSVDCNRNVIPDICDIAGGTSLDVYPPNGVPDECDPGPRPLADASGLDKARFISFTVSNAAARDTALRVKLVSLHHVSPPYPLPAVPTPFTLFEGQVLWVGPPTLYVESSSNPTRFSVSQLQCTPHYRDWSMVGLLHVTGEAVVPSSTYEVENVAASCQGNEANCTAVSAPLTIVTGRWGDVVANFQLDCADQVPVCVPCDGACVQQPDFDDISSLVNKFKSAPGAPIKARAMLAGESGGRGLINLELDLGFTHISADVDAFKRLPYPYKPGKCTGGLRACGAHADCVGSTCVGGANDGAACNPGDCTGGGVCTPNTEPCFLCP